MKKSDLFMPYDQDLIELVTEMKKVCTELIGETGMVIKELTFYPDDRINPDGMRVGIAFEQIGAAPSALEKKIKELRDQQERMDQAKKQASSGGSGI